MLDGKIKGRSRKISDIAQIGSDSGSFQCFVTDIQVLVVFPKLTDPRGDPVVESLGVLFPAACGVIFWCE